MVVVNNTINYYSKNYYSKILVVIPIIMIIAIAVVEMTRIMMIKPIIDNPNPLPPFLRPRPALTSWLRQSGNPVHSGVDGSPGVANLYAISSDESISKWKSSNILQRHNIFIHTVTQHSFVIQHCTQPCRTYDNLLFFRYCFLIFT